MVFLIGGVVTYRIMGHEVQQEERRFLLERLRSTENYIKRRQPSRAIYRDKVIIKLIEGESVETKPIFSDTIVSHVALQRPEKHNKLDITKKIADRYYKITLYDIIIEQDDIVDGVIESMIRIYAILFLVVLVMAWALSKWLLLPFENTLQKIKNIDIKQKDSAISFEKTNTVEFRRLNNFIQHMSEKIKRDYQSIKEFSENASHEIQTPLSIAKGKLELLTDTPLTPEQSALVKEAQKSLTNLSKLGKMLTLLAKIDNREFEVQEETNISFLLEEIISHYEELIHLKGLRLETDITPEVEVRINPSLFEILVNNLLNNAIKHNYAEDGDGYIQVHLTKEGLSVKNSGKPLKKRPEEMFERFQKENHKTHSLGLGLSIITKIAEVSQLTLTYQQKENWHLLSVKFSDSKSLQNSML